jgi:hypothetical protein
MAIVNTTVNRGNPYLSTLAYPNCTPASVTVTAGTTPVAGAAADVLGGLLLIDCQDVGTYTMPTAAALIALIPGAQVGTSFRVVVRNTGDSTLTIAGGTGGTISGVATIATANTKEFLARVTGIASGSEAITYYSLGTRTT